MIKLQNGREWDVAGRLNLGLSGLMAARSRLLVDDLKPAAARLERWVGDEPPRRLNVAWPFVVDPGRPAKGHENSRAALNSAQQGKLKTARDATWRSSERGSRLRDFGSIATNPLLEFSK
jgi:hypothetical protein